MEGFFPSPAGGWVTSAPRKITGCWNTEGLQKKKKSAKSHLQMNSWCKVIAQYGALFLFQLSCTETFLSGTLSRPNNEIFVHEM